MHMPRRRMGNSAGMILSKPVLAELVNKAGDSCSEKKEAMPTRAKAHPRSGWAATASEIAMAGDDGLVWPEFGNTGDNGLAW